MNGKLVKGPDLENLFYHAYRIGKSANESMTLCLENIPTFSQLEKCSTFCAQYDAMMMAINLLGLKKQWSDYRKELK